MASKASRVEAGTPDRDLNTISEKELTECDTEKIHLLGQIQGGAGNVVFFSYPKGQIVATDAKIRDVPWIRRRGKASATTSTARRGSNQTEDGGDTLSTTSTTASSITPRKRDFGELEGEANELLGSYLQFWVPYGLYLEMFEAVEGMKKAKSTRTFHFYKHKRSSYALTLSTTSWDCSIVGIEIEVVDGKEATSDFYSTLVSLGRIMEFYVDEKIVKTACDTIFKLLGHYDRGMVYQFNDDLSGEVVHEIKNDTVSSSYLGMRFPASDIPLNARKLYIKNGMRYIHNVDSEDVPMLDRRNGNSSDVDLSHCRMRSCAKPHIIYLRNMGVVSSLSIAIVVENELWGLLAFHGYNKPFKPSLHQRIACETVSVEK